MGTLLSPRFAPSALSSEATDFVSEDLQNIFEIIHFKQGPPWEIHCTWKFVSDTYCKCKMGEEIHFTWTFLVIHIVNVKIVKIFNLNETIVDWDAFCKFVINLWHIYSIVPWILKSNFRTWILQKSFLVFRFLVFSRKLRFFLKGKRHPRRPNNEVPRGCFLKISKTLVKSCSKILFQLQRIPAIKVSMKGTQVEKIFQ